MWQEGVTDSEMLGVCLGIVEALFGADMTFRVETKYRHVYREAGYRNVIGLLEPHASIDWYVEEGRTASMLKGHLNGSAIMDALAAHPNRKKLEWWDVVVVREPLHWHDKNKHVVIGLGARHGALVSVHHYRTISKSKEEFQRWVKLTTIHELGHMFGLFVGWYGKKNPTDAEIDAAHCRNICVMRSRDDQALVNQLLTNPFCHSCLTKLRSFFLF